MHIDMSKQEHKTMMKTNFYFQSSLKALQFGKENGQTSVYILSTGTDVYINYD